MRPPSSASNTRSSARLWLSTHREELIGDAPAEVQAELRGLDTDLRDLLIRLSIAMWDRKDAKHRWP